VTPPIDSRSKRAARILEFAVRHPRAAAAAIEARLAAPPPPAPPAEPFYAQYRNGLPSIAPLNLRTDAALDAQPRLNVLIPGMAMRSMSGGPNTAINLVYRMAHLGVPLRFISTDIPMDADHEALRRHFSALTGMGREGVDVEIACGADRSTALAIGCNDAFFASAWWNVQMIKHALPLVRRKRFFYIIQDFEPGLYSWSTEYALALETYSLDYYGILCGGLLAQYMLQNRIGAFADPAFVDGRMTTFEPAVDRSVFHPQVRDEGSKRRLVFYARPQTAKRNLFELGLYALRTAVETGVFDGEDWELLFMGEALEPIELGRGLSIRSAPWMDYQGYGRLLRESDIALSLMLSPHTSYPPLEMAACGRIAVTNTFANKTAAALTGISPNIVPVDATLDGVVAGLREAVRRRRDGPLDESGVRVPHVWEESFAQTLPWLVKRYQEGLA
jgi:hypothetical protein